MKRMKILLWIVSLLFTTMAYGQSADTTTYDFRDGTIITNGESDDGSLILSGTYNHHGGTYGLDMKVDARIKIAVEGSCTVSFLGSAYSSLSMSAESYDGSPLDPDVQATKVDNDLSDTYEFTYVGEADTLIFTATGSGSDVYLPVIKVISATLNYDFRDGTIITAGQTSDGSLKISGTYNHHGDTYGLDMKVDAQIKLAVPGSCIVRFLGSAYSSLDMSGETYDGVALDPGSQTTKVDNDLTDTYEFAYSGSADTLIFTATGSGSDVYLPLLQMIPTDPVSVYDFRDGSIITNGRSDDGLLVLSGTYSHHGDTYGMDMKAGSEIQITVSGSCIVRFLGSAYSSLDMSGATIDGEELVPSVQSTTVASDLVDTYEFAYYGFATSLVFTATGSGSDVYLPLLEVIPYEPPVAYDFRDGTIITNGQSDDGSLKLSGTYNHHGDTYGLDMKAGAQIKIAVPGSCMVKFLGSAYSSLSMSGETYDGTPLDPAVQATVVANDLVDEYVFAYSGETDTLIFTATGSGSDIYLPLIEVVPGEVKAREWVEKSGDVRFNSNVINIVSGTASGESATVTVLEGTVISATDEVASVRMDLGGNPLSSFTPEVTDDIHSVTIDGDTIFVAFSDSTYLPFGYKIIVADNSTVVEAEAGKTYVYMFNDGSVLPQTSYSSLRYTTFVSEDGILTLNSNTDVEAGQFGYHDASHGGVFFPGNSMDIIVAGNAIVTFIVCTYGSADDAIFEITNAEGTVLGSTPAQNIGEGDAHASSFAYSGPAGVLTATLKSEAHAGAEIYIHGVNIENAAEIIESNGKIDVWDFGAEQLDAEAYNNRLTVDTINSWYDAGITVGSSGNVLPPFTAGVLSWVGGSNDRLRTTNTSITRYDENISGVEGYTGRVYVNSSANTGRYMSLNLSEDDEVTLVALSQNGGGRMNFEYVSDPVAQTDQKDLGAEIGEYTFVAKQAGTYHIYDDQDKPSYYRIYRKDADYATITGTIDASEAPAIPDGYGINFENAEGKIWNVVVSEGAYSVTLPTVYTYELSLSGANGYIISNGNSIEVTEDATYDISVKQVELYTVSGAITGLDAASLANLSLEFVADPATNKIFVPECVIDVDGASYTVELEPECNYTIEAEGVNDYYITDDVVNIGHENTSRDVAFTAKPVYAVTFNVTGLTADQLANLELSFTNLNEEGYIYDFASVDNISLRDGTYTIAYSGMDDYPVELGLTSNLTVDAAAVSKDLAFVPVTHWTFDDKEIVSSSYKGLLFTGNVGNEVAKGHLSAKDGATIQIPVSVGSKVRVTYYYSADFSIEGVQYTTSSGSTSTLEYAEYAYTGDSDGFVTITFGSGASTTYITDILVGSSMDYQAVIYVGADKEYQTVNGALAAIASMVRSSDERVTVMIDPGNYEEMLVITVPNVTLKNAAENPGIGLLNAGVDIEDNAVRITSYYGHGYNYYSMGSDQKWDAEVLRVNKENGYLSYENKGAGTTNGSYWNATVVVSANGFEADHIIFENSFNQYISEKEANDVVVMWESGSKGERPTDIGNTTVQYRTFVERAAAIAITNNIDKVVLNRCRVVGRQDSFYGGTGSRVAVNRGAMMGAVDYIFGGMIAVFYKTDLVMNTSDVSSDATYFTAAQQSSGRGYLMYKCAIKSAFPGIETASQYSSKPGYFGRPWQATTSEVVFYNTTIDSSSYPGYEGKSLISPPGWTSTLGGESEKMYEFGSVEKSGEDNSSYRADWSTLLSSPTLTDGTDITTFNFTKGSDNWDPFPVETDEMSISTNAMEFLAAGESKSFDIQSNVGWAVTSNADWLAVEGVGSGIDTATIQLTAVENTSTARTATVTVYGNGLTAELITVTQLAGVGIEGSTESMFRIYPNPAKEYFMIERAHANKEQLYIMNQLGQVVYSKVLESEKETVNLESLEPGIYFVKTGSVNMKLVVN